MANAILQDRVQDCHQGGVYQRIEVITGPTSVGVERGGQGADRDREPCARRQYFSEVARRNGVNRGMLNVWRRHAIAASDSDAPAFVAVTISGDAELPLEATSSMRPSALRPVKSS